jgi:hypothetical protein
MLFWKQRGGSRWNRLAAWWLNNSSLYVVLLVFRRAGTFLLKDQKILQRYTIRDYIRRTPCRMLLTVDTDVQKNQ